MNKFLVSSTVALILSSPVLANPPPAPPSTKVLVGVNQKQNSISNADADANAKSFSASDSKSKSDSESLAISDNTNSNSVSATGGNSSSLSSVGNVTSNSSNSSITSNDANNSSINASSINVRVPAVAASAPSIVSYQECGDAGSAGKVSVNAGFSYRSSECMLLNVATNYFNLFMAADRRQFDLRTTAFAMDGEILKAKDEFAQSLVKGGKTTGITPRDINLLLSKQNELLLEADRQDIIRNESFNKYMEYNDRAAQIAVRLAKTGEWGGHATRLLPFGIWAIILTAL